MTAKDPFQYRFLVLPVADSRRYMPHQTTARRGAPEHGFNTITVLYNTS